MSYQWISWYHLHEKMGEFELNFPWWESGIRLHDDARTICAAIPNVTDKEAETIVRAAYDRKTKTIEWRFNSIKEGSPFADRFQKAKWMTWPKEHEVSTKPVKLFQVWEDTDPRFAHHGRRVLIAAIDGNSSTCINIKTARKTTVRLDRFKKSSTGYQLVKDWP